MRLMTKVEFFLRRKVMRIKHRMPSGKLGTKVHRSVKKYGRSERQKSKKELRREF
jgi:hypothetical protein